MCGSAGRRSRWGHFNHTRPNRPSVCYFWHQSGKWVTLACYWTGVRASASWPSGSLHVFGWSAAAETLASVACFLLFPSKSVSNAADHVKHADVVRLPPVSDQCSLLFHAVANHSRADSVSISRGFLCSWKSANITNRNHFLRRGKQTHWNIHFETPWLPLCPKDLSAQLK